MMTKRLLVVDDDPLVRGAMMQVLTWAGYLVCGAETKQEAFGAPGPFDGLIVDLRLPNGDGSEILQRYHEIPAITMSGNECVDCDLPKPFGVHELLERVKALWSPLSS